MFKQSRALLLTVLAIALFGYSGESVAGQWPKAASGRMTFPEKKWQEATPESQGVDSDKLDDAISYLKNNSGGDGVKELVIIRNGYMIWKGTNIDKVHGVWSLTKSFTSTVLGLLIDDGKTGLDTLAREHIAGMAANYPDVALRHFTTMTSGYYAVGDEPRGSYKHGPSLTPFKPGTTPLFRPPGSKYAYWDSAMNQFANILTVIGGEPIETLFKRKIADPIGMNRGKWDWGDFGKVDGIVVNGGSGNHNRHIRVSARELARFGHLYLNRGNWNGKQLISASWIDETTSVQVPASLTLGHPSSADGRGVYGCNWWTNGIKADGKRKWPGAPIGTYAASGYNNNDMFVIPKWNMVIVRLGLDGGRNGNISDAIYGTFLRKVGQAIGDVGIEGEAKRQAMSKQDRIKPYAKNPRYWQYKRKPVLLLGGTDDDNLFQWTGSRLIEQLDLLKSVGGNYLRCTMSSRDEGNVWPFKQDNGKYDLDQWNEDYWNRFERMLKLTRDRDIIVQIEVWAFHDFNGKHWKNSPWRPADNVNYSASSTYLKADYGNIGRNSHDFFFTVPKLNNDGLVLAYQQKFVDKMLSHSLRYGHVLYCMTNEIHPQYSPEWGWYWAGYIKDKAAAVDRKVETTEMYWETDLKKEQQRASLEHPEIYSYFEASQNSDKRGQENWNNLQFAYNYLAKKPRPINHVKIYGADTSTWNGSTDRHATECFWRNIIGGSASSRFHRPPYGLGLSRKAQAHIKSLRMLTNEMNIFTCTPHNDLLSNRKENGAYATANPGKEYAVYFSNGAEVDIDLVAAQGRLIAKWLDIAKNRWAKEETLEGGNIVALTPPGKGHWVVLIKGKMTTKSDRIRISPRNPRYFEYKQKPVFLTGARELEMLPRVGNYPYKQAVDRLAEAGCNHWRIEMYLSDSDREGKRKYPIVSTYKSWWHNPATGKQEQLDAYRKNAQGKFDLNLFNEPFWNRFQDFCELCAEKGIVLTVEIWSTYAIWATSPFNPKNNINYSGSLDVGKHGRDADSEFSFVRTVPALGNRPEILKFQKKFAKKVLDCTWQAGNVLYVCGNENRWPREWVEYWADYVHKYGKSKGVRLLYTNIPEHVWHRASSGKVEFLFDPAMEDVLTMDRFDFADMSQLPGGEYPPSKLLKYDTVVDWYKRSKNTPRPITMLKNYIGTDETDVGKKRRDVLTYFMAGAAMSGFHRPWAGECPEGRWNNCAKKMRKVYLSSLEAAGQVATFTSGVEFVDTSRRNDLVSRGWCLANPGKHYIVYLKKGGESVDVKLEQGSYRYKAFDGQLWSREDKFEWSGGWRTFSKAGNEDWGLYIVRGKQQTH